MLCAKTTLSLPRKVIFCHKDTKTQRFHEVYYDDGQHFVILRDLEAKWHFFVFDFSEWAQH